MLVEPTGPPTPRTGQEEEAWGPSSCCRLHSCPQFMPVPCHLGQGHLCTPARIPACPHPLNPAAASTQRPRGTIPSVSSGVPAPVRPPPRSHRSFHENGCDLSFSVAPSVCLACARLTPFHLPAHGLNVNSLAFFSRDQSIIDQFIFKTGSFYIGQAGLRLVIFQSQLPTHWECRCLVLGYSSPKTLVASVLSTCNCWGAY